MVLDSIVPRRVSEILAGLLTVEPVIALHGPRSVGKSTVLRRFAADVGGSVLDLDDIEVREAVLGNLASVVAVAAPVCVDEYQRVPDILDALKARLNREGSLPGTAVITGSTRQDALPATAQALTGRLHSLTIWPLSQGEIVGVRENLLNTLATDPDGVISQVPSSKTTRQDYVDRVCAGGLPLALRRTHSARARWFDDFVRASVERDALELGRIRERQAMTDLLGLVAAQTGQLLNISAAAEKLGVSRATAESHLRLLEDLFLVVRMPAWGKTLRSRVSVKPKVHLVDSGLAARLLRLTPDKLTGLDPASLAEFGHLLETFVVGEIRKQASWLDEPVTLGHWRTSDGAEVDLVVEYDDGTVLAFEVKASERAPGTDFRGLAQLRDALGPRFAGGIILTTGTRS
jgi:predicted AAA+ superfamily ATPase